MVAGFNGCGEMAEPELQISGRHYVTDRPEEEAVVADVLTSHTWLIMS